MGWNGQHWNRKLWNLKLQMQFLYFLFFLWNTLPYNYMIWQYYMEFFISRNRRNRRRKWRRCWKWRTSDIRNEGCLNENIFYTIGICIRSHLYFECWSITLLFFLDAIWVNVCYEVFKKKLYREEMNVT